MLGVVVLRVCVGGQRLRGVVSASWWPLGRGCVGSGAPRPHWCPQVSPSSPLMSSCHPRPPLVSPSTTLMSPSTTLMSRTAPTPPSPHTSPHLVSTTHPLRPRSPHRHIPQCHVPCHLRPALHVPHRACKINTKCYEDVPISHWLPGSSAFMQPSDPKTCVWTLPGLCWTSLS